MTIVCRALLFVVLLAPGLNAAPKKVMVGPNVFLEIDGEQRRVIVEASVVLRKGVLEGLLTRAKKKEHEYILAADVDARHIHAALELARARKGNPVQFVPKFVPPTGSPIRVTLRYGQDGKTQTVSAREWIRDGKTGKPLMHDWVFAGSQFGPHPEGEDRPPYYLANHGDLICLCNMEMALLDLPVRSPKAINDRLWEAATERIPPTGTRVEVVLEVVADRKP
jgi:hypothetical protein